MKVITSCGTRMSSLAARILALRDRNGSVGKSNVETEARRLLIESFRNTCACIAAGFEPHDLGLEGSFVCSRGPDGGFQVSASGHLVPVAEVQLELLFGELEPELAAGEEVVLVPDLVHLLVSKGLYEVGCEERMLRIQMRDLHRFLRRAPRVFRNLIKGAIEWNRRELSRVRARKVGLLFADARAIGCSRSA